MPPDRDRQKPVVGHLHVYLRNIGMSEVECTKTQAEEAMNVFRTKTSEWLTVDNAVFLLSEVVGLDYCEQRHRD
jgi:hypothetical protein